MFREAEKLRQEQLNSIAWLQGMYVYDAIARLSPILHAFAKKGTKPRPYTSNPYSFRKESLDEDADEQERLKALVYMNNMVRAGRDWGK